MHEQSPDSCFDGDQASDGCSAFAAIALAASDSESYPP